MRQIHGRTFYWNDGRWNDANVQGHEEAKKVQVKFDSDEYFALLAKHRRPRRGFLWARACGCGWMRRCMRLRSRRKATAQMIEFWVWPCRKPAR